MVMRDHECVPPYTWTQSAFSADEGASEWPRKPSSRWRSLERLLGLNIVPNQEHQPHLALSQG